MNAASTCEGEGFIQIVLARNWTEDTRMVRMEKAVSVQAVIGDSGLLRWRRVVRRSCIAIWTSLYLMREDLAEIHMIGSGQQQSSGT